MPVIDIETLTRGVKAKAAKVSVVISSSTDASPIVGTLLGAFQLSAFQDDAFQV